VVAATDANIRLVVGLGNPGADYVATRHNAGCWLIDALATDLGASFRLEKRFNSEVCKTVAGGRDLWLAKPQTFMNLSGQAVAGLARYYRFGVDEILVMHDELDLPPGTNRLKFGGGPGGHNGLRDIIRHLGNDFYRLRIGIGHPGQARDVKNYVLRRPSQAEAEAIDNANRDTLAVMPYLFEGRVDKAMQALHTQ